MEQPRPRELTADEFIAWAAEQPTGRFELAEGVVVAMAPERVSHTRAKLDAAVALRAALASRGLGCEALADGVLAFDPPSLEVEVADLFASL
jgi:Uma2 family endonuclease